MSEVIEQGATRRVRSTGGRGRPLNNDQFKRGSNPYVPPKERPKRGYPVKPSRPKPGQPGYEPRYPRNPDFVPPRKRPNVPGHASPLTPKVNPDGGRPLPNALKPLRSGEIPGTGRALPDFRYSPKRLPRLPLPGGPLWDIIPLLDVPGNIFPNPNPFVAPTSGAWFKVCGPEGIQRTYQYGRASASNQTDFCGLGGQALSSMQPWPPTVLPTHTSILRASRNNPPGAGGTFTIHEIWKRDAAGPTGQPSFQPYAIAPGVPMAAAALNPNLLRGLPSMPSPFSPPVLEPGVETIGATLVVAGPSLGSASLSLVARINQTASNLGVPLVPDGVTPDGVAVEIGGGMVRPVVPGDRQPPMKNEKHGKLWTKSRLLAVLTFGVLDDVSEGSEVIDAFFDALPPATREKWKCGGRGLTDQAGQYGIDGADCKAKALYYNFHKLDFVQAVENLVLNYIQDKVLGLIHRSTPANSGSAFEGGMMEVNDLIMNSFGEPLRQVIRNVFEATAAGSKPQVYSYRDAVIRDRIRHLIAQM